MRLPRRCFGTCSSLLEFIRRYLSNYIYLQLYYSYKHNGVVYTVHCTSSLWPGHTVFYIPFPPNHWATVPIKWRVLSYQPLVSPNRALIDWWMNSVIIHLEAALLLTNSTPVYYYCCPQHLDQPPNYSCIWQLIIRVSVPYREGRRDGGGWNIERERASQSAIYSGRGHNYIYREYKVKMIYLPNKLRILVYHYY